MAFSLGPGGLDHTQTNFRTDGALSYSIAGTTYNHSGNLYSNQASRLMQMPTSGDALFVGKVMKKGDFNYVGQNTDIDIMFAQWSSTDSYYQLKCRGTAFHDTGSVYFWVDSSRYLWFWNNDQWQQRAWLVVHYIQNVTIDCQTATSDMHNWTGQTRYAVTNGTEHTREATYGN